MAETTTVNGKEKTKHTLGATDLIESMRKNDFGEYCECMEIYLQKFKDHEAVHAKETRKRKASDVTLSEKQPPHNPPA